MSASKIPPSASMTIYAPIYPVLIIVPVSQDMKVMAKEVGRAARPYGPYQSLRDFL